MSIDQIIKDLKGIKKPIDFFGDVALDEINQRFKDLSKVCHPDICKHPLANEIFGKLSGLRDQAEEELKNDTYRFISTIESPSGKKYNVRSSLHKGAFADSYLLEDGLFRIAVDPSANLLMLNEFNVINTIYNFDAKNKVLNRAINTYIPKCIENFELDGNNANILQYYPNYINLADLMSHFPNGLDPKHVTWIWRRMLTALGVMHTCDYIHCSLDINHFLVNIDDHGGKIVNFCFAAKNGGKVKYKNHGSKRFYPPEINNNLIVSPATDVYMSAKIVIELLGGDPEKETFPPSLDKRFVSFVKSCLIKNPSRRPQNSLDLHEDFGLLLMEIWGEPKFQVLTINNK